jgi:hypothetical protein
LLNIIKEDIQDEALIILICKMFKVNILNEEIFFLSLVETSHRNPLIFVLNSIFYSKLDDKVISIKKQYEQLDFYHVKNPAYVKIVSLSKLEIKNKTNKEIIALHLRKKIEARKKKISPLLVYNSFISIKYVRYLDIFLLSIRGPESLAIKIKKKLIFFLKSELHLCIDKEKTELLPLFKNNIVFCGVQIQGTPYLKINNSKEKQTDCLNFRKSFFYKLSYLVFKTFNLIGLYRKGYYKNKVFSKLIIKFFHIYKNFMILPLGIKPVFLCFQEQQIIKKNLIIYQYLYSLQKRRKNFFLRNIRKLFFQKFQNTQKFFVNVFLFVNLKIVKKKLEKLGIINNNKPYFLKNLVNFSDMYIIAYYNNIISDFFTYYQFVKNFGDVQKFLRYFIS